MTADKTDAFIEYVYSFYGADDAIYQMHATKEQIGKATGILLQRIEADPENNTPFDGDTVDRERVRDILIAEFDLVFPPAKAETVDPDAETMADAIFQVLLRFNDSDADPEELKRALAKKLRQPRMGFGPRSVLTAFCNTLKGVEKQL